MGCQGKHWNSKEELAATIKQLKGTHLPIYMMASDAFLAYDLF